MYINGEFVSAEHGESMLVYNPATEKVIAEVPSATPSDVNRAVQAATLAQAAWAKTPAIERAQFLKQIANNLRAQPDDLAHIVTEEQGKTLSLARDEVLLTADYIEYMAEWARRYEGEIIQSDRRNENLFIFKQPVGVVAGILPWNFPLFLMARKMAPALVTGNAVVIKPSEDAPINSLEFAKIVDQVGVPKGIFNVVTGDGPVTGAALASHPQVGLVSFTGSYEAGSSVMKMAAKNIARVSLELGGKAPAIVMKDANLDLAVDSIVKSRIINTGQACNCAERIYVHQSIEEEFTRNLVRRMEQIRFGDPLQESGLDMGPLINKEAVQSIDEKVQDAVHKGAKVLTGGHPAVQMMGCHYEPTVLVDVTQDMPIMRQEIFGPVLPVMKFETFDEVIALANDCEYGLTSSIYTKNLDIAMRACNELKFGETYINRENFETIQGFHAGWRRSGIGGDDGKHGLEEFLQTHIVYLMYDGTAN
ncbi:aldehyde dehydrogenase [Alicyclobacillaceae bacterium I2511]|nr:aldehyde dehydrogenase [Alicyclobacillaceae bacterium I2511]